MAQRFFTSLYFSPSLLLSLLHSYSVFLSSCLFTTAHSIHRCLSSHEIKEECVIKEFQGGNGRKRRSRSRRTGRRRDAQGAQPGHVKPGREAEETVSPLMKQKAVEGTDECSASASFSVPRPVLPLSEVVHPRSLSLYGYIMGCLNRWHCSILISHLTAYIWLLRHLVNGLQQRMSNPILQLERFTNFLTRETGNIIT